MSDQRFYLRFKGRVLGPFSKEKASEMVKRGQITRQHELSTDGRTWGIAAQYKEFFQDTSRHAPVSPVEWVSNAIGLKKDSLEEWYANIEGENYGPVNIETMKMLVATGRVQRGTLILSTESDKWVEAQLAKPEWFIVSQTSAGQNVEFLPLAITASRARIWITIVAIGVLVIGVLGSLATSAMFLSILSTPSRGFEKSVQVVAALAQFFAWIFLFYIGTNLIALSSRLASFSQNAQSDQLQDALLAYYHVWKSIGIYTLACCVFLLCFTLVLFSSGATIRVSLFRFFS